MGVVVEVAYTTRRKRLIIAAVTLLATTLGVAAAHPARAAGAPLRQLAEAKGRYFGTALTQGNLANPTLTNVAGAQFDMVTPGNEMKWETTEPSQGSFNFGPGDQIVAFAKAHGARVRGHNLVWHSQLAPWVNSLPVSQVKTAMENHITGEVSHYRGQLFAWDVVNEPFNEDGSFRQDVFTNAFGSGPAYIADALRTARAADPSAKLYLNDFNIEGTNAKSNAMFNLVQSLKSQGVPIDGVGFESHFILGQVPSSLQSNLQRFANLGVDVAITELDDRIQLPAGSSQLTQQANEYAAVVRACLAVSRCVGITQWGVGDADSWIPGAFPGFGAALTFDNNYQPKPAFTSVQQALGGGSTSTDGTCTATYHVDNDWGTGFTATVTVANGGTTATRSWHVTWSWAGTQKITNAWNATAAQTGANVTADNASFNAQIAGGSNTTFGFQAAYSGTNTPPTPTCTAT
jgi:endo-1,4-beta-xylanase